MEYLGHVVANDEKIQAMVNWVTPSNMKKLCGFLGLTCYCRKFVRGYGEMLRPPTALLRKNHFKWSTEASIAFEQLKLAMTTVPVSASRLH